MTRKNVTKNNISSNQQDQKDNNKELSLQEVYDVVSFAQNITSAYPGLINPLLLNSRMQDLSFNPLIPTETSLAQALNSPKQSEEQLRGFVEHMEIISSLFSRILSYVSSMAALDYTYTCITPDIDYKSDKYKKAEAKVIDFLDRFDHQRELRKVIKQLLRNETVVVSLRDDGDGIILQELPLSRCKLTARYDGGFLISFDFLYFLEPGIDLRLFHPFFLETFNSLFKDSKGIQNYNPTLPVDERGQSRYIYYVDCPPDVAYVFKLDESLTTSIPHYASLLPDLVNQNYIRLLQKNVYIAEASKLIIGAVPLLKDTKSKLADMISVSPAVLGQFLGLMKSAIGDIVRVAAAPLEGLQKVEFEGNDNLLNSYNKTAANSSGVNAPLIYSGELKANAIESQLSFQSDSLNIEQAIYPQLNSFFRYFINQRLRGVKFDFHFEGNAYYLDRGRRLEDSLTLTDKGIVLYQKIAAALGMKPQTLLRMMKEGKDKDFVDMLTPIISSAQMSGGGTNSGGRPSKKDSELTDSGEQTRSDGGNLLKGGKK